MLIPASDAIKHKADAGVAITSILGFFNVVPWPNIAAALAALYTLLRIVEWFWDRFLKRD